ncbi:MAG TPA: fasciclin domain-containing protein [Candidatus Baltobacteraceae bacterium]|nr:fasciclin domain-containing protein [Candidatus Baltobacteraceae bacterium]
MRLSIVAARRALAGCLLSLTLAVPTVASAHLTTVLDLAAQQKNLSTFVAAIHTAGLDDTLKADGPFTLFAPTDEAFAKMPAADRAALLASPDRCKQLVLGLLVKDAIVMHDGDTTVTSGSAQSADGRDVKFGTDADGWQTVDGAHVVRTDMKADNGRITTLAAVPLS